MLFRHPATIRSHFHVHSSQSQCQDIDFKEDLFSEWKELRLQYLICNGRVAIAMRGKARYDSGGKSFFETGELEGTALPSRNHEKDECSFGG